MSVLDIPIPPWRFTQRVPERDTFAGIPTSPQSLHKYTYTHNNPIRYTDPSGHIVWFAAVPLILGVVEVGLSIYDLYETGKTLLDPCASNFEKGVTVALFVGGIFMPGGGYTAGGKATARNIDSAANYAAKHLDDVDIVDDVQDVYKVTNKLDDARDANQAATTIDDVDTIKKFDDLPCVPNSFVAGTLVESSDGLVPIETLAEGDLVWAVDPETGAAGWYPITWTTSHEDTDLVTLSVTPLGVDGETLSSTQEHTIVVTITATLEHPFWVDGAGWVDAGDLRAGDTLLSADGRRLVVQAAVRSAGPAMVYNFTVDALHTYTITELRVVVHNVDDFCKFDEAIEAALKSGNPDIQLEGEIGALIRDDPDLKLVRFQDPVGPNASIGEIDVETPHYIVEVTGGEGSDKHKQIIKLINNTDVNPSGKKVILYGPNINGKHRQRSLQETGAILVKNKDELLQRLKEIP